MKFAYENQVCFWYQKIINILINKYINITYVFEAYPSYNRNLSAELTTIKNDLDKGLKITKIYLKKDFTLHLNIQFKNAPTPY